MRDLVEAAQAVSFAEYKRAVHIAPDDGDDDTLFDAYLQAAQAVVETATRRLMVPRSVEFDCRNVGWGRWWFPVAPVAEVTAIEWQSAAGWVALPLEGLRVEQAHSEPQLIVPEGYFAGVDDGAALRIAANAGLDAGPERKKLAQAVIMITQDWYDAGIAADEKKLPEVSFGARALIKQNRYKRPAQYGAR